MKIVTRLLYSSVGKKAVMAVTGLMLVLFVVGHLLGNLQVFAPDGGESINAYAHFLKSNPWLLWTARLGLLLTVALHIGSAIQISAQNRAARTFPYDQHPVPPAASYASRTMLMSGVIIASFIAYHLLHFTVLAKAANLSGIDFHELRDPKGHPDVFRMLVIGFSQPVVVAIYIVSITLLCMHLSHGVSAVFQTLGLRSTSWNRAADELARALAWVLFIGYTSIPACILFGLVK